MAPFYEECCRDLGWPIENKLMDKLKQANRTQLEKLDGAIADAEKNLGEMEVREANLRKAEYLSRIGKIQILL